MSSTPTKSTRSAGFTLVEMLVVAPVAMLVIVGLVAVMVSLVGDALMAQQRNIAIYDTQSGLEQIEQDVRLSSAIASTTGTLTSPQGSDSGTAAFNADTSALSESSAIILSAYATTTNPASTTRTLVYTNQPTAGCIASSYTATNDPLTYTVVYFVKNDPDNGGSPALWRRVIVPSASLCNGPAWQKNSCFPGTTCATNDRMIVADISSVNVTYYFETTNPYSRTSASSLAIGDSPTSIHVTIATAKKVAGATIDQSASIYASKINN